MNIRDRIRREYVTKGPCQPKGLDFPKRSFGKENRAFRNTWYKDRDWLEYSISKDAAYCFWCYLFKHESIAPRDEAFTDVGYCGWRRALERFDSHVGKGNNSSHKKAAEEYHNFVNQKQSLSYVVSRGGTIKEMEYRTRLTASLDVIRFLLDHGLPFRGHDESETSLNRGLFLDMLKWYAFRNDEVGKVVLHNAPANNKMSSPPIQKDLVKACAIETTNEILREVGDKLFSIMVDEARDCSVKEQMAIVIRYVNQNGEIIERFLALVHVRKTTSIYLKEAIDSVFSKFELSLSRLRGQGYDGASNMRGEFNGLKALILKENPSAWYVHCFAHQLQLVCVAICKTNAYISNFFDHLSRVVAIFGSSCKRVDALRQAEHEKLVQMLDRGEICTGRGQNQETSLHRPGDTRWGSHFCTIARLASMWSSVTTVLDNISCDGVDPDPKGVALGLLQKMETFEFVFIMKLMQHLLGIIDPLSCALQQKDQNIVDATYLIEHVKESLKSFRESGWETILEEVNAFCVLNDISLTSMDDLVPRRLRIKYGADATYSHLYRVEIFYQVVDMIIQEMENHFPELTTELLRCMACLDPRNNFSKFDVDRLVHLASLYPRDFLPDECSRLRSQLQAFIGIVRKDSDFSDIEDMGSLARMVVQTKKHKILLLVYRLIELVLLLPVATASVERVFSAMNHVKSELRNKMGDEWLNDSLMVYIERSLFNQVCNERILQRFQSMDTRRMQLSQATSCSQI